MKTALIVVWTALACGFAVSACGDDSSVDAPTDSEPQGGAAGEASRSLGGELHRAGSGSNDGGVPSSAGDSAGGAAGAHHGPCRLGADWQVVDDYVPPEGPSADVIGVAADALGNVYAVGVDRSLDMPLGALRRSSDSGATWTDVAWLGELPNDIASDRAGHLFVTAGTSIGAVLKSTDQGETFAPVFDIPTVAGSEEDVCNTGFVAAGPAKIVVAGGSCDSTGWVVAKSKDGGETWDTLFTFQLSPGKPARLQEVGVDAFGRAYAVGSASDAADAVHWVTVREGETVGTAVVSDDFQLEPGLEAQARGFSSHGAPVVVGFASDAEGTHGIVRRQTSVDAWETIARLDARVSDVEAVGAELVLSGEVEDDDVVSVSTRRSDDSGTTWHPLDVYGYVDGHSSTSGQLATDATGNVYASIAGLDQDEVPHWIIRKLVCR
jgi:hypothetical protein